MAEFIATVDRFEGDFAVLKHKDHEILIPKEDLPENISEGGYLTIIIVSSKEARQKEKTAEKETKEKVDLMLDRQKEEPKPPITTQDKIEKSFEEKPTGTKIQEVINDVLGTALGQEPVYESPEKKEIKELRQISGKMDNVSQNIKEEIKEHKEHEKG